VISAAYPPADGDVNDVIATIPDIAAAAGKLFGHVIATQSFSRNPNPFHPRRPPQKGDRRFFAALADKWAATRP
jgi:hypothetical protein